MKIEIKSMSKPFYRYNSSSAYAREIKTTTGQLLIDDELFNYETAGNDIHIYELLDLDNNEIRLTRDTKELLDAELHLFYIKMMQARRII